jgi:nitrite reductase (NADH) large subunit
VRVTDFLCSVKTPEDVLEYCAAFLQIYREEAHYLERTAPWVERVGLTYIKQRVVEDAESRRQAAERFHYSQRFAQIDPWAQRAQGVDKHEFIPLKRVS